MDIPSNVKIKTFPWTILPILSTYTAHAIYPNIFLPRHIYQNLQSKYPDPKNISILIHEETHIARQKKMGWFIWGFKYCLIPTFRFEEEIAAIKESMKYLKSNKLSWNIDKTATFLSSYLYLWCVNKNIARQRLEEEWKNA